MLKYKLHRLTNSVNDEPTVIIFLLENRHQQDFILSKLMFMENRNLSKTEICLKSEIREKHKISTKSDKFH